MRMLPFENYCIKTNLGEQDVLEKISNYIDPKNFTGNLGNNASDKPYRGKLEQNNFILQRNINYRNSFQPIISGSVVQGFSGTEIKIRMRMEYTVLVFLFVWLCIALGSAVILTFIAIRKNEFEQMILIPWGLFIFGYVLCMFGFKLEAEKSKRFLESIFEPARIPS